MTGARWCDVHPKKQVCGVKVGESSLAKTVSPRANGTVRQDLRTAACCSGRSQGPYADVESLVCQALVAGLLLHQFWSARWLVVHQPRYCRTSHPMNSILGRVKTGGHVQLYSQLMHGHSDE
jgi:hypothetical protein